MAIDYGQKRVGLAVTDPDKIIATALDTVHSKDIFSYLKNYTRTEYVECFVIGEPRQMNNSPSESVKFVDPFIRKLVKEFPEIRIDRYDERYTSKIAQHVISTSGIKKKDRRNKSLVDKVSAVLLLQSYLDYQTVKHN